MALRKTLLITGEYYHVYNRSAHGIPIFSGDREKNIFIKAIKFYLQPTPPTKFSVYRRNKNKFPINLSQKLVGIINYCIMPNHFHLTLRQEQDDGIKKYIQRLSNSFAHYWGVKYKDKGPVFEGNYKAVHIENNEQLLHLSRYIHLNPVTAYLVEKPEDYNHSSYKAYLDITKLDYIDLPIVQNQFSTIQEYQDFVMAQKDYQRDLDFIKHLILE